jgi:serralysin
MARIIVTDNSGFRHDGTADGDDFEIHSSNPNARPVVFALQGDDQVRGGMGHDSLFGGDGNDTLAGKVGNDVVNGGTGNDSLSGGAGFDIVSESSGGGDDVMSGGSGNDYIIDWANYANDPLDTHSGNDLVYGGSGDDTVFVGGGDDHYSGGSGFDTLNFFGAKSGVTVDISKGTADGLGHDLIRGFEMFEGSSSDDTFKGSSKADVIRGNGGNDTIRGLGGADTLTGGAGDDTFAYFKKDVGGLNGVDHITDFSQGDKLDLRDFFKGHAGASLDTMVHIADGAAGSTVSLNVKGVFVDVAVLDNFHGSNATDMLAHGMLLT